MNPSLPGNSTTTTSSWDSLQQWHAHNRVWMLYSICNGLVTIPPDHLKLTTVATRRHETRYMQIQCNSCMYSQMFFPSTVRLWNHLPPDICFLPPDSFKLELSKINLFWSCIRFLSHRIASHRTARFYFLVLTFSHCTEIPQHMTSTCSAILLYNRVVLVSEDEPTYEKLKVEIYSSNFWK